MSRPEDTSESEQARGAALESSYAPLVGYFHNRVRRQDEVQYIVKKVFLPLSNRGALTDIDNLRDYTIRVAEGVRIDRQRRRVVRQMDAPVELDPERMGEPELAPDRILAERMELEAAIAALDQLPARTRTIFVLRRIEEMRYFDIAKRLNLSLSAVEEHMVRATANLAVLGGRR